MAKAVQGRQPGEPLRCTECAGEQPAGERGWRAYLTVDDEIAVYCASCAEREFGRARRQAQR